MFFTPARTRGIQTAAPSVGWPKAGTFRSCGGFALIASPCRTYVVLFPLSIDPLSIDPRSLHAPPAITGTGFRPESSPSTHRLKVEKAVIEVRMLADFAALQRSNTGAAASGLQPAALSADTELQSGALIRNPVASRFEGQACHSGLPPGTGKPDPGHGMA